MNLSAVLEETFGGRPSVQQSSFIRVKTQFSCLYKQAMLQLYVNGFIRDPGRWDKNEIANSMREQGYNMVDTSGRITLDESYALEEVYKEDYKEGIAETYNPSVEFYLDPKNWENYLSNFDKPNTSRLFYLAIKLREILESLDRMYNCMNFDAKGKKFAQNRILYSTGVLRNKVRWGIDEGTAQALAGYGTSLRYHSFQEGLSKSLYAYFGEYRPQPTEEGRFVKGVSVEQEAELLSGNIDGSRMFYGELGNLIFEWNSANVWHNNDLLEKSLETEVKRQDGGQVISDTVRAKIQGIGDDEVPLTLNGRGFFTRVKNVTKALHMSGHYVFDSLTEELLNPASFLSGMNGELIEELSEDEAIHETGVELEYTGSPILVHNGESYTPCQDVDFINNSRYLHGGKSLFLSLAGGLSFDNVSPEDLMQGVDTTTVEGCIRLAYAQSESGYFGPVVGEEVLPASEYSDKVIKVAGEIE